jgi:hypothetical protein
MSYDSHFTGRIDITPPLTWLQVSIHMPQGLKTLQLAATEAVVTNIIAGDAVVPLSSRAYNGHGIHAELQSLIDAFPGKEFSGTIEAHPEDPDGTPWRYIIRDRTVVRQEPAITWVDSDVQQ